LVNLFELKIDFNLIHLYAVYLIVKAELHGVVKVVQWIWPFKSCLLVAQPYLLCNSLS